VSAPDRATEDLLRALAPRVLGALVRRHGQFDACEDAVQEALLAAALQWPEGGVPDDAFAWLMTVAGRRLVDAFRAESARRGREDAVFAEEARVALPVAADGAPDEDDSLLVLLLCCDPALSAPSQLALTLRAVGGLTTAQVAAAFLVPEATMAQRISRAKATLRRSGLTPVEDAARAERMGVVLHVLYLMFNEGYMASSGEALARAELTAEAIRLTRMVHALLPGDGEVTGLLSLMLLTDARRAARVTSSGDLVPLAEQDRLLWDGGSIAEGLALIEGALRGAPLGPYQVQAAIAALHAEAVDAEATDWAQILALYRVLERLLPGNPIVSLNHAVAVAEVDGPRAALAFLDEREVGVRLGEATHRADAVRAHLLERAGSPSAARELYRAAARRTTSLPERRYLESRAAALD
jgi:RNA polymerase sigma factor (sigma-70 family)